MMNETTKFIRALSNLTDKEVSEFWRFIAREVKHLPEESKLRSALCIAILELKAGRNQPRTNTFIKSQGMRALSKEKLYESILNQRERLVPFIDEYKDWKSLISHWILMKRLDSVLKVLDALNCIHDEKGARLEDQPPTWSHEEATQRLMALSSQISFADLEIIAAGLFCNHEGWHYLEEAINQLHKAAKQAKQAAKEQPTSMTVADPSPDLATRVQALPGQIDTVVAHLRRIADELQAGRLPDLATIASTVEPLQTEWTTLIAELRPTEQSLEGLKAALGAQKGRAEALALLDRLERLRHRKNPEFASIALIQQRCVDLHQRIAETSCQDEAIAAELKPLCALERLIIEIIEHEIVDEAVIEELDAEVREHFGPQTAIAAITGQLEFAEPDLVVEAPIKTINLTENGKHLNGDDAVGPEQPPPPLPGPLVPNGHQDQVDDGKKPPRPLGPNGDQDQVDDGTPPPPSVDTKYGAVATLLKDGLAKFGHEDWVQQLGGIQRSWLERRQPLRAWLLASEVERQLTSHQIHIQDSRFLSSWACRLLLVTSDAKLPLSDEDKELLYRIRNLSSDSKELIVLWITAALFENATDKPLRIIRLVSPRQFDLPSHSLGSACVEQLLTPVFNGGSLLPLRDPADFQKEFDQAIQKSQEILDRSNNYSNGSVKKFWRGLIARTGRVGQILAEARQRQFPARTLSVEVIVEDIPEWADIKSAYRNNMHNRMEEFANQIEAARSAHQATQRVPQANQSTISKQAIAEILAGIQRQTGNAWWLEVIKSGIADL